jgi:high-affinity Fe2+/Pb2+ permease
MEELFGIISPFLCAVLIVLIIFLFKTQQEKSRNDLMKSAIEHGRDIPADFFKKQEKPKGNLLTTSLFFIGFGIGIALAFYFFFMDQGAGFKFASIGLVFLFIGLGQLVAYLVDKKNKKSGEQDGI